MAQHPCGTETGRVSWGVFDGVASVSGSMAASVAINRIDFSPTLPVLGFLKELSHAEDGVVIVATLLLLPTAALLYGGSKLIFAAKEAVERKAVARGIQIGRAEGKVEGKAEGREEGKVEGRAEGREEGKVEGRAEGKSEGRQEERERIRQELAAAGLQLTPEQERVFSENRR